MAVLENPYLTNDVVGMITEGDSPDDAAEMPFVMETIHMQSLTEALSMLMSKRVDFVMIYDEVCRYIAARNESVVAFPPMDWQHAMHIIGSPALEMDKVNEALATLKEQGTLEALWQTHVLDILDEGEPVAVELPRYEEGPTLRVGVSGDLPPIDYTTVDGSPAGLNTALIAALAAEIGWRLEMVSMEGGARFAALQSGAIDMFFWHQMPVYTDQHSDEQVQRIDAMLSMEQLFTISDAYCELALGMLVDSDWSIEE